MTDILDEISKSHWWEASTRKRAAHEIEFLRGQINGLKVMLDARNEQIYARDKTIADLRKTNERFAERHNRMNHRLCAVQRALDGE